MYGKCKGKGGASGPGLFGRHSLWPYLNMEAVILHMRFNFEFHFHVDDSVIREATG